MNIRREWPGNQADHDTVGDMMNINKKDIIRLLEQIAIYLELKGENSFKISAFRKAAAALEADDRSLSEIEDFQSIPGIGKGTEAVISEYLLTGESTVLAELKEEVPKGLIPLLQLPGLGGKKIARLYSELGVENIEGLRAACREGRIAELKGFGPKSQEKILQAAEEAGTRPDRLPIAYMLPIAEEIENELKSIKEIIRFSRAGSLRRMAETLKDLDFVIATEEPASVREKLLALGKQGEAIASGNTKVSVTLRDANKVSADFRMVKPEEFATALHHFTGSKDHNVRMRQLAKERGEKISEYGVEDTATGKVEVFENEASFYRHFGLPYIPPEIREDGTEVEEFQKASSLIELSDIKGDLHMHTTWSDGAYSVDEMVEACRKRGYRYMAITDHSKYLKVANGLNEDRLRKQREEIRRLNDKYDDIVILAGVEMDILPGGELDFDDEFLAEMDIVIASIHSSFSQSREKIMERLKNALFNKHVDIIAHPTGRLIGRREGYDADVDMLIRLAAETNTALELNANPNRLDLSAENVRKAQEQGVKIVINTDAHNIGTLDFMEIGASAARKGRLRKDSVLNAMDTKDLLAFLKRHEG